MQPRTQAHTCAQKSPPGTCVPPADTRHPQHSDPARQCACCSKGMGAKAALGASVAMHTGRARLPGDETPSSAHRAAQSRRPRHSSCEAPCFCLLRPPHSCLPTRPSRLQEDLGCSHVLCLVARSCLALCNPMNCSLASSSVHWILQARVLEWVAMPFSRGSSRCRN